MDIYCLLYGLDSGLAGGAAKLKSSSPSPAHSLSGWVAHPLDGLGPGGLRARRPNDDP